MPNTETVPNFALIRYVRDSLSTRGTDRAVLNALALTPFYWG